MENLLKEKIKKYGLAHLEKQILNVKKDAIYLIRKEFQEKEPVLGTTRFGGFPDLPPTISYPENKGKRLNFIAQINFSELSKIELENKYPKKGILYFFYDELAEPWDSYESDELMWKVIFFEGDESSLERKTFGFTEDDTIFKPLEMRFIKQFSLPSFGEENLDKIDFNEDLESDEFIRYLELLEELNNETEIEENKPRHQMGGYPSTIQNDVFEEVRDINGGHTNELTLLLQVDSDDDLEMLWGDMGMLYFCIEKEDLKNKNFENIQMTLQCY